MAQQIKSFMRQLLPVLLILMLLLWVSGFIFFVRMMPEQPTTNTAPTDAIIVVTGGPQRITTGVMLLEEKRAPLLFISGVRPETLAIPHAGITYGHEARSTVGNAYESENWVEKHHIRSARLVTSAMHMPRCLMEFERLIPHLTLIPHPIFASQAPIDDLVLAPLTLSAIITRPKTLLFFIREYHKYILALFYVQHFFKNNLTRVTS